jgi:hypothetical protein
MIIVENVRCGGPGLSLSMPGAVGKLRRMARFRRLSSSEGGAAQSNAMRVYVRVPAPNARTLALDLDADDFLATLQAKVSAQTRIAPDSVRFLYKGERLPGNMPLKDYNLPEDPVVDLVVHFQLDVEVPSQPSRATYARLRKDSWGRSRLLKETRERTYMTVSREEGAAACTCSKCGIERAPALELSWHLKQQGAAPCTRATTFRPRSRVNLECVYCGNEAPDHYRAGRQLLCYDAEKFSEKSPGRLFNVDLLHEPEAPPGTCRRCGHNEHHHQSAARYCFQKQHWLCCVCRELEGQLSCQTCQSRVQAIRALELKLALALESDKFADAMAAVAEARHRAGPAFYDELDEIWKLGLSLPSGIEYLASAEGAQYIRDGVLDASYSKGWVRSSHRIQYCFERHMQTISGEIEMLSPRISELRICNNPHLMKLPLQELCRMRSLQILSCLDCPNLLMPPPGVSSQGGDVTMRFMRDVAMHGGVDERCTLFTIGEFASGKTSVINALLSTLPQEPEADAATNEQVDGIAQLCTSPTLAFQTQDWVPAGEEVRFVIFDLGGHPTMRRLNQLILAKRAVYLLAWRARRLTKSGNEGHAAQTSMVLDYLDDLRYLVPGAAVILVVTHIDYVTAEELEAQRTSLRSAVHGWLQRHPSSLIDICLDAQSICLNGRSGAGASILRSALLQEVRERSWYRQPLSSSWAWFAQEIAKCGYEGSSLALQWAEYVKLARHCGIKANEFQSATIFMQDTARIRCFDLAPLNGNIPEEAKTLDVEEDPITGTGKIAGGFSFMEHTSKKSEAEAEVKADKEREKVERESELARASFENAIRALVENNQKKEQALRESRGYGSLNHTRSANPSADLLQQHKQEQDDNPAVPGSEDEESVEEEDEEEVVVVAAAVAAGNQQNDGTQAQLEQDTRLPFFQEIRDRKEKMKTFKSGWSNSSSEASSQRSVLQVLNSSSHQVYVSFKKMSAILKGLFRQNRCDLLKHFARLQDAQGLTMVCRLHVNGILDPALLPYLWPRTDSSYWEIAGASAAYHEEVQLWGKATLDDPSTRRLILHPERRFQHVIASLEDEKHILQFLQEFNVLAQRSSGELVVWDLTGCNCARMAMFIPFEFLCICVHCWLPWIFFMRIFANRRDLRLLLTCLTYLAHGSPARPECNRCSCDNSSGLSLLDDHHRSVVSLCFFLRTCHAFASRSRPRGLQQQRCTIFQQRKEGANDCLWNLLRIFLFDRPEFACKFHGQSQRCSREAPAAVSGAYLADATSRNAENRARQV